MMDYSDLTKEMYIFGSVFLVSNKMQVMVDRALAKYKITAKQWLLIAVISEYFAKPPMLKEVAEFMGSSHQNIKQIALKLEKRGFMTIAKDDGDNRALRLALTEKCIELFENRQEENLKYFAKLFASFSAEELNGLYYGLYKLNNSLDKL